MATTYGFTCPEGHKFDAIAKLRARCPNCGKMARRNFQSQSESPTPSTFSPISHKVVTRKDMENGSKPDMTLTPEKKLVSSPAPKDDSKVEPSKDSPASIKKPQVVKMGLKRTMPKTVKPKTPITAASKIKSPVTRKVARVGHTPIVTRPPKGSKERKVVEQTAEVPYWQKVKRQFFG